MTEREMLINTIERINKPYFWYDDNTLMIGCMEIIFNEDGQIISIL